MCEEMRVTVGSASRLWLCASLASNLRCWVWQQAPLPFESSNLTSPSVHVFKLPRDIYTGLQCGVVLVVFSPTRITWEESLIEELPPPGWTMNIHGASCSIIDVGRLSPLWAVPLLSRSSWVTQESKLSKPWKSKPVSSVPPLVSASTPTWDSFSNDHEP